MQLVLLGAPGSGKGVQGQLIVKEFNVCHVSTGNILRAAIQQKTPLGIEANKFMEKGQLVPDELIVKILEEELRNERCSKGFVLDGVPRTIPQAIALEKSLQSQQKSIDRAIYLDVDQETLIRRLTNRRTCVKCARVYNNLDKNSKNLDLCPNCGGELIQRTDDNEETVRKRFVVYDQQTKPLLDFYQERGILLAINGDQSPDRVFENIRSALDKVAVS